MVEIVPVEVKIIAITVLDPYFSNGWGPDIKHSRALKYLILDVNSVFGFIVKLRYSPGLCYFNCCLMLQFLILICKFILSHDVRRDICLYKFLRRPFHISNELGRQVMYYPCGPCKLHVRKKE